MCTLVLDNRIAMTNTWKISFGEAGAETIRTGNDSYYFFREAISLVSEPAAVYDVQSL